MQFQKNTFDLLNILFRISMCEQGVVICGDGQWARNLINTTTSELYFKQSLC